MNVKYTCENCGHLNNTSRYFRELEAKLADAERLASELSIALEPSDKELEQAADKYHHQNGYYCFLAGVRWMLSRIKK